jgi:hypothetical protein
MSAHMDVSHLGTITVSVGQDIPSSMVKMGKQGLISSQRQQLTCI